VKKTTPRGMDVLEEAQVRETAAGFRARENARGKTVGRGAIRNGGPPGAKRTVKWRREKWLQRAKGQTTSGADIPTMWEKRRDMKVGGGERDAKDFATEQKSLNNNNGGRGGGEMSSKSFAARPKETYSEKEEKDLKIQNGRKLVHGERG